MNRTIRISLSIALALGVLGSLPAQAKNVRSSGRANVNHNKNVNVNRNVNKNVNVNTHRNVDVDVHHHGGGYGDRDLRDHRLDRQHRPIGLQHRRRQWFRLPAVWQHVVPAADRRLVDDLHRRQPPAVDDGKK